MTYRVIITPNAEHDLRDAYNYIRERAPDAATRRVRGIRKQIKTLSRFPERCPLSPESDYFQVPVRESFCGSGPRGTYRILFVLGREVSVVHVRHGSRDAFHS